MLWDCTLSKAGFDVQKIVSKNLGLGDANRTFNFGSVLDFTQNQVTPASAEFWHEPGRKEYVLRIFL